MRANLRPLGSFRAFYGACTRKPAQLRCRLSVKPPLAARMLGGTNRCFPSVNEPRNKSAAVHQSPG